MADAPAPNQLFEQWRKQLEEGAQAWARLVTPNGGRLVNPSTGILGGLSMEDPGTGKGYTQLPVQE